MRLNKSLRPGDDQQHKERDRQHDTHGKRFDHALGLALVVNQVKQSRAKTRDDADQADDDKELNHGEAGSSDCNGASITRQL